MNRTILIVTMSMLASLAGAQDTITHPSFPFERLPDAALAESAGRGELLISELNCVACHTAPAAARERLSAPGMLNLSGIGRRVTADFLRSWLAGPHVVKPGTTMPDLLAGMAAPARAEAVDALTHMLGSLASGAGPGEMPATPGDVERGRKLYHAVGCVACHQPFDLPPAHGGEVKRPAPGPVGESAPLGDVAGKYTLAGLSEFLADPLKVRPGGRMPSMNLTAGESRAIAAYLLRGKAGALGAIPADADLEPGLRYWYFEGDWSVLPTLEGLTAKTTGAIDRFSLRPRTRNDRFAFLFAGYIDIPRDGLYSFILRSDDGSKLWIDGEEIVDNDKIHGTTEVKNSLELKAGKHSIRVAYFEGAGEEVLEVLWQGPQIGRQAIPATALWRDKAPIAVPVVDQVKAARGRQLFTELKCAACHTIDGPAASQTVKDLTSLNPAAAGGCLSDRPRAGVPAYRLSDAQRNTIAGTLKSLAALAQPLSPVGQLRRTMAVMNCYACHPREAVGGPSAGRLAYFHVLDDVDLGDEGRIPPTLHGVGAKLKREWIAEVLAGRGAVRPYMATRMPKFGDGNTAHLAALFEKLDLATAGVEAPGFDATAALDGRKLIGADGGLSCITCHTIAGQKSLGVPAVDLALTTKRLRYDWYRRYILDPASLRPGTRMPMFFDKGIASVKDVQEGNVERQIAAMWTYLSQGMSMPLPPGIISSDQYELTVGSEPLIMRTFFNNVGQRAIVVGYPELLSIAFDADRMKLAQAWRGKFISAKPIWDGRGGNATGPLSNDLFNFAPGMAVAELADAKTAWPGETGRAAGWEMRGYRLDAKGRPVFVYAKEGLTVHEQALPTILDKRLAVARRLTLYGESKDIHFRAAVGKSIVEKGGLYRVDDKLTVRFVGDAKPFIRDSGGQTELLVPLKLAGAAAPGLGDRLNAAAPSVEVEVTW